MAWSGLNVHRSARGGVITIGNFDGVHQGHQAMLAEVVRRARERSSPAVAVTFDPHPINVLKPEVYLPRLTTIETRSELLKKSGIDEVVVLPVNNELLSMAPQEFFSEVILEELQAVGIVEGPDFRFGHDRAGDTVFLAAECEKHGVHLTVFPAVLTDGAMISSTRIRRLLSSGQVADAVGLLGHSYALTGTVEQGAGRGRQLGFPTANLSNVSECLPANAVYAGECSLDGERYPVALNIGPNPTFGEAAQKVECHLVGYSGDLYECRLCVRLLSEVRPIRSFDSLDELKVQIRSDVEKCVDCCRNFRA